MFSTDNDISIVEGLKLDIVGIINAIRVCNFNLVENILKSLQPLECYNYFKRPCGTSKLYDRKCYGYKHDAEGKLIIDKETAENVKLIFDLYLNGKSVIRIFNLKRYH